MAGLNRPIFLIGYMCSGKTTLGAALARALSCSFIDLDQIIENQQGLSVSEIFAKHGEAAFRRLEAEALDRVCTMGRVVVACGGGTPCQLGAMERMNAAGLTVWLKPCESRLVERLMQGRTQRPLIAAIDTAEQMREFAQHMLEQRRTWYSQAAHVFDSSFLDTAQEIDLSVNKFLQEICQYTEVDNR